MVLNSGIPLAVVARCELGSGSIKAGFGEVGNHGSIIWRSGGSGTCYRSALVKGEQQCLFDEGSHPTSRDTVAQQLEGRSFELEGHGHLS